MQDLSLYAAMLWSLPWKFILPGFFFVAFVVWAAYWIRQGRLLAKNSGHYSPRLTFLPQLVRFWLSTLIGGWFVGPLRVHGWENTEGLEEDAGVLIAPNHQRECDGILAARGLRLRSMRFLMAINQVQGWRGPLFAWLGAISVGYDPKNPASAAAESSIKVMSEEVGSRLVLFPQGTLIKDDEWDRKQFKHGAVRIVKAAAKNTGRKFYLVPVVCIYEYDANHATWLQRLAAKLKLPRKFFGVYMYGATVMIGKPIDADTLPDDEDAATDIYYQAMLTTRELCRDKCQH